MLCLSLCHTIITQTVKDEILYNASSPDELALINFAKLCGYRFMGIDDDNIMTLRIYLDPLNP
jgi:phospholipid-transporting ATPase